MTAAEQAPRRAGHLPGDGHMWVMVLGDLVIFSGYFVVFMIYRSMNRAEFLAAQQHLNITIGVVNTLILLTSSWFVARAVLSVRAGDAGRAARLLWYGSVCGAAFVALKCYEWFRELTAGQTNSQMFY